jgi:ribosomal protein S18 acetylase RimI-like enzyme
MIRAGLWQVPFKFGMGTLKRVLRLVEAHELEAKESTKQHHQNDDDAKTDIDTDFVHLERMVVLPEYQGQGWGSRALKETLEQETKMVRLATQEERNVRFYHRLGFEIAGERDIFVEDDDGTNTSDRHKYHSWFLIRNAMPTPTSDEETS